MKEIQILNNGESLYNIRTKINENFDILADKHLINTGKLTNCILEEPQLVDVTISGGYLTLKQNSTVIIPNGFDSIGNRQFELQVIDNDLTSLAETSSGDRYCFWVPSNAVGKCVTCYSGSVEPTGVREFSLWYDTANNVCKRYANGSWTSGFSLPFALATFNDSFDINHINVYQSVGYVGSHVWVNKSVKCLIPNGLNENGTVKNIVTETTSILVSSVNSDTEIVALNHNGTIDISSGYITDYEIPTTSNTYNLYYDEHLNKMNVNSTGTSWEQTFMTPIAEIEVQNGVITYFNSKHPIRLNQYATPTTYGLIRTASYTDELNCNCEDASITPNNLYNLENYRIANTQYMTNDKVACPYHHDLQLTCIQPGTTSETSLDTHDVSEGDVIEDGTVIWKVETIILSNVLDYNNITNCILEAPSGVFVQNSDGKYMIPKGTRFLSADGKDENGNIKNLDVTLTSDVVISSIATTSVGLHMIYLQSNNKTSWFYGCRGYQTQWFEQDTLPNVTDATWFSTKDKLWRIIQTADGNGQWYIANCVPIALVEFLNGAITKVYKTYPVVEILTNSSRLSNLDAVNYNAPTTIDFNTLFQAPTDGKIFVMSQISVSASVYGRPSYMDCAGFINPTTTETGITVTQEYTQIGTYTFNAPTNGWYNMILVGGGGNGISALNMYAVAANGGGGSGACFAGQVYLTAGDHTITVGGGGGATSIDGLIIAGAGGNASMDNLVSATAGAGGTLTVTGQTQNATIYANGNAGSTAIGSHCPGGASLYNGWGSGGGSNSSPAAGYAFISYQGSTSATSGILVYSNYVYVNWDSDANTVTSSQNTSDWISLERGQTIKFVTTLTSGHISIEDFYCRFYPNKKENEIL